MKMSRQSLLNAAAKLRKQADEMEARANRKLPHKWEIGMKVRYVTSQEWAWSKGDTAYIVEFKDKERKLAHEYQVFYTSPKIDGNTMMWTDPDDVEWIEDNEQ
jgi:hypothetical protein